jgi:ketosteroid isomerase-like protein
MSGARDETAAYIVLTAPKMAPTAMIAVPRAHLRQDARIAIENADLHLDRGTAPRKNLARAVLTATAPARNVVAARPDDSPLRGENSMLRVMRLAAIPGTLVLVLAGCTEKKVADTGAATDTTMAATTTTPAPAATPTAEAPPADLRSRADAMAAAWNQDNAAALGAYFATDATVHFGDSTYTGRADIVKRWIAPALPTLSNLAISNQSFTTSGDGMTETGNFSETWTMPKTAPAQHGGTYTITWNKTGADWMVKQMTVNDTTTVAAPAPKS